MTKQIQDPETGELISLLPVNSQTPPPFVVDSIIYFNKELGDPAPYYKRYIENYIDPRWFGAKGSGTIDDSVAFKKAVSFCQESKHKILLISEGCIFELGGKLIDIGEITLCFTGGIIKNATLKGFSSNTYAPTSWIDAGCYQIFDTDVILMDNWTSAQGTVWADWYGSIANNYSSTDLKYSIEALNKVFKTITLNKGHYFSDICNIQVNSLIGQGIDSTIIDIRLQNDGDYGFLIGKKGGNTNERTFNNVISNLYISMGAETKSLKGTAGIVLGATQEPLIENVKINNVETFGTENELRIFTENIETRYQELNCGLLIDGLGELATVSNLMTISQVGVFYKTSFDFINFVDYTHWGRGYDFSTVFIAGESGSNSTFTGSQSWSKVLFGLYAMPADIEANFTNWLIENLRIEQLAELEYATGKYIGASIYIGNQMWLNNLIVRNTMLGGTSNGVILNNLKTGYVELDNIKQYFNAHSKKAIQVEFIDNTVSCISLKNVQLHGDFDLVKAAIIDDSYSLIDDTKEGVSQKIISRRNCIKTSVNGNILYKQKEFLPKNNINFVSIIKSKTSDWPNNQRCKKIDISVIGINRAYYMKFYYFKDGSFRIVDVSKNTAQESEIIVSPGIIENKFTVVKGDYLFLFNRFNEDVQVFIDHEDLIY